MKLIITLLLSPFFLFSQTQIGNDIDGILSGDNAGYAVSLSSDGLIVAVGSPGFDSDEFGQVRVFENINNNWIQIGEPIIGENISDHFGSSVSLSADGSIIAISAPDNEESLDIVGYVSIYQNITNVWTQLGDKLYGEAEFIGSEFGLQTNFSFGNSVSISDDGSILAIAEDKGSTWESGYGIPGNIYIYENISGTWTQIGDVINTGITYLNNITLSGDGFVVAISGDGDSPWGWFGPSGHVKAYNFKFGAWTQIGNTFSGTVNWEELSMNYIGSVSLNTDGSKMAIGGKYNGVYENIADEWVQLGDEIEFENNYNHNISLSDDGTILCLSARFLNPSQFVTRIYIKENGAWTQIGIDITDELLTGQPFSFATGLGMQLSGDGKTLVIGAPFNDNIGYNAGHSRVYDLNALLSLDQLTETQFKLFPNPAKDQFIIQLQIGQKLEKVNIYNNLGQFVKDVAANIININELASGLYYIEVITNKGKTIKSLIKE